MVASLNPFAGVINMLGHDFIRNALLGGTAIAIAAGLTGYFLVLRSQVFSADALSHVAFTGAVVALAFGVDARVGLFAATIAVALLLGALGPRGNADDVVIGSTFAWILGIGVLALSMFTHGDSGGEGTAGVSVLFGSIYGLDSTAVAVAVVVALIASVVLVGMSRPLLFATIAPDAAAARGVPVRALAYAYLVIVGVTAAESAQAVGALLLIGLLAAPAGVAVRVTARPYRGMAVSAAVAVAAVWGGLALSYAAPALPPSFSIMAIVTAAYVVVLLA